MNRIRISLRAVFEVVLIFLLIGLFIDLTTHRNSKLYEIIIAGFMIFIPVVFILKFKDNKYQRQREIWAVLAALAFGFWSFSLLRLLGIVFWPLSGAATIAEYGWLLYYHIILSVSVLLPLLLVDRHYENKFFRWGKLNNFPVKFGSYFLTAALILIWIWVVYFVLSNPLKDKENISLFLLICVLKAFLTGATEEICYRGVIQPVFIKRFGPFAGILMQSCLYAIFHIHLGEVFFGKFGFLSAVIGLGFIFGTVTYLSGGIGWAFAAHAAINVVVEWQNIS